MLGHIAVELVGSKRTPSELQRRQESKSHTFKDTLVF